MLFFILLLATFFLYSRGNKVVPYLLTFYAIGYLVLYQVRFDRGTAWLFVSLTLFPLLGDMANILMQRTVPSSLEVMVRNLPLVLPLMALLHYRRIGPELLLNSISLLLVMALLLILVQYTGLIEFGTILMYQWRPSLWFNPVPFSNAIVFFAVFLLGLSLQCNLQRIWPALLAGIGASLLMVLLSETRGSLLALSLVALCYLLFLFRRHRISPAMLVMLIALISISLMLVFGLQAERLQLGLDEFRSYFTGGAQETSVGIRLQVWQLAWQLFLDQPLLGAGVEAAIEIKQQMVLVGEIPAYVAMHHAHSDILDSLERAGLVGLAGLFWLYCIPVIFLRRRGCTWLEIAPLLMLIVAAFLCGLTDTPLRNGVSGNAFYLCLMFGLALALNLRAARLGEAG
ncbi:O-antigen ligase family protein [Nitrincola alkalilacustris]|uniref:O-antigen ligase family protein n=1 Tax=Nitrincola alkalilacustris TaxID=1571224 RepID=UPI00124F4CAD|nr:O-antigen ligase family protein [Nitrincola alkalilacustris]